MAKSSELEVDPPSFHFQTNSWSSVKCSNGRNNLTSDSWTARWRKFGQLPTMTHRRNKARRRQAPGDTTMELLLHRKLAMVTPNSNNTRLIKAN